MKGEMPVPVSGLDDLVTPCGQLRQKAVIQQQLAEIQHGECRGVVLQGTFGCIESLF